MSNISHVIHRWAQQNKAHGKCGNVRFDGQRLFSYWAEIGRFYPNETKTKQRIVVLSQKKYSHTTSGHQSCAWSATSQYFRVEHDEWTSELPIDWQKAKKIILAGRLAALKTQCEALRSKRSIDQQLSYIGRQAIDILAFYNQCFKPSEFPKRSPFTLQALRILGPIGIIKESRRLTYLAKRFAPNLVEKLEKEKERNANKSQRELIRAEAERLKSAERLELWKQGADFHQSIHFYGTPIYLRVKNEWIETSRGARVPIAAALALYDRLKSPTDPIEGFQVGEFTVRDCYGTNGQTVLRVGCHEIPMSEIERIRGELP
jgi:hypothetical protein